MPSRNRRKLYNEEGYYHVYNRGINKNPIFHDTQDYIVFLLYLKEYLLPKDEEFLRDRLGNANLGYKEKAKILKLLNLKNFADEITLLAYSLMPNHFHFFIKQKNLQGMNKFMLSLCTRYTMYFNLKYKRIGHLYQDTYKAANVIAEPQFIYLSKYIHIQALASKGQALQGWKEQPSSYLEYLGKRKTEWVHPEEVLGFFSKEIPSLSYETFINGPEDFSLIQDIVIEE